MSLAESEERFKKSLERSAKVLTFDIETQRAQVEIFSPFQKYIDYRCVLKPTRMLCFSARWHGAKRGIFKAAWDDNNEDAYLRMCQSIRDLLHEAHVVVTWNGDRFDLQWVEEECGRLGLGRPRPYQSCDLIKIARKRFGAGLMYRKLDWSARTWLRDAKINHQGSDLWWDIRHGSPAEKRAAQKLMREYCEHDTYLTERMFNAYLPWVPGINMALFCKELDEGVMRCTCCGKKGFLKADEMYYTGAFGYRLWFCTACEGWSRGKRNKCTTDLRSIP